MSRAFLVAVVAVSACQNSTPNQPHAQVAIRGIRQALSSFDNATLAGAALQVNCKNGQRDNATAIALADTIVFSPVQACGDAELLLSVQVLNAGHAVTAFLGSASANLSVGEVHVDFSGSLAGDIAFSSSDGESFQCNANGQLFSVPATGAIVPLIAGSVTVDCTGSSGTNLSVPLNVIAGTQTPQTLPPQASNALIALSVTTPNFLSSNGIAFDSATQDYALVVATEATSLFVIATPASATATLTINGAVGAPASIAFGTHTLDVVVTVTDAGRSENYTVHVARGTKPDDAYLSNLAFSQVPTPSLFQPLFSTSVLSYYVFVPAGASTLPLTVVTEDPGATASVAGQPVSAAASLPVDLIEGNNVVDVHVVAEDGFTYNDYVLNIPQAAVVSDTTLQMLTVDHGVFEDTPFAASTQTYSLFLSSRRSAVTISAIPSQAGTAMLLNGKPFAGTLSESLSTFSDSGSNNFTINVSSIANPTGTDYNLTVWRGLIKSMSTVGLNVSFSAAVPCVFSNTGSTTPQITVNPVDPASITLVLNGQSLPGPSYTTNVSTPLGSSIDTIEATGPGGETDSYWLDVAKGGVNTVFAALATPGSNSIRVINVTDTGFKSGPAQLPLHTDTSIGLHRPTSVVVSTLGTMLYFAGDEGVGWTGVSNSAGTPAFDSPQGLTALAGGNAGGSLAIDPENRFVFVLDGDSIDTLQINIDGSLSPLQQTGSIGATSIAADSLGRFVYAAIGSTVVAYEIDVDGVEPTGALSSTAAASQVLAVATSPSGDSVYYADTTTLYAAGVNTTLYGTFGSPNNAGPLPGLAAPMSLAVSGVQLPTEDDDYVVLTFNGSMYTFGIEPNGQFFDSINTPAFSPGADLRPTAAVSSPPEIYYIEGSTLITTGAFSQEGLEDGSTPVDDDPTSIVIFAVGFTLG